MSTVMTRSLRQDLIARFGEELSVATIDQTLRHAVAATSQMATPFRTIFAERDCVEALTELARTGQADPPLAA